MMTTPITRPKKTDAEKRAEAEAILAEDQSEHIARAEIVIGAPNPNPPISLRISPPLLEALDRLALVQHRKRTNLIQHILWEYVHAHEAADSEGADTRRSSASAAVVERKVGARSKVV